MTDHPDSADTALAPEGARRSEPAQPQPPAPLSHAERLFVRMSLWQTVLSVAGVFVGIVALYAALNESEAVRLQTAAAVWPFVQLSILDFQTEDGAGFTLTLENSGVGPARLRAMRVVIDGQPRSTWRDAVTALVGGEPPLFAQNFASNRVLSPGERIDIFSTSDPQLVAMLRERVSMADNSIAYCYCSIFDDCWVADSRGIGQEPEPVAACPDYGEARFRN
ncbi:MAG: hypothetical protein R3E86_02085 [Pseudomonadales bacterium]